MAPPPVNLNVDVFVLQASHREVEAGDVSKATASLYELLIPEHIRRLRRKLVFEIAGYNDDPRDLWEFPKVRKWMNDLDRQWPFWFFFMNLGRPSTLSMVTFCLCQWTKVPGGKLVEEEQLIPFVRHHMQVMLGLCSKLAMDQKAMTAMAIEILEFYGLQADAIFGGVSK